MIIKLIYVDGSEEIFGPVFKFKKSGISFIIEMKHETLIREIALVDEMICEDGK